MAEEHRRAELCPPLAQCGRGAVARQSHGSCGAVRSQRQLRWGAVRSQRQVACGRSAFAVQSHGSCGAEQGRCGSVVEPLPCSASRRLSPALWRSFRHDAASRLAEARLAEAAWPKPAGRNSLAEARWPKQLGRSRLAEARLAEARLAETAWPKRNLLEGDRLHDVCIDE